MATKHPVKKRPGLWRVWYTIEIPGTKKRKSRYSRCKEEADALIQRLSQIEQASRTGIARHTDIDEWIDRNWLTIEEASLIFRGYADTASQTKSCLTPTDYDAIAEAFESRSLRRSKDDPYGKNHSVNMSRAKGAIAWLRNHHTGLNVRYRRI